MRALQNRFAQIQVSQGKVRSGLEVGTPRAGRDRIWFHAWGTDSAGKKVDKGDCFLGGEVWRDTLAGSDGWRRELDFSLSDRDSKHNLQVEVLRDASSQQTQLVIRNPGRKGTAEVRVDLGPIALLEDVPQQLSQAGTRVVFVKTDHKAATGERITTVEVGPWANQVQRYTIREGRFQSEHAGLRHWAETMAAPAPTPEIQMRGDHVQIGAVRLRTRQSSR